LGAMLYVNRITALDGSGASLAVSASYMLKTIGGGTSKGRVTGNVAGVLWRIFASGATTHARESVETKIEAISFGFLVPIFFITTGVNFDLHSLIDAPRHLIYVPIFLVALLVLRGLPSLLVVPKGSSWGDRRATVLFGSTSLPIIIAVTTIGVQRHLIDSAFATALVTAGMLSVIIFPLLGMSQRRRQLARESQQQLLAEDDS
ncbi:MAG: cation:proton antiporter, partial [Actinomycetota bacterium]